VKVGDGDHDLVHASVSEENGELLLGLVGLHNIVIVRCHIPSVVIHEIAVVIDMHRCI
jgi:hypothetical protein